VNLDYNLPASSIAARPTSERDGSRLLCLDGPSPSAASSPIDHQFTDLPGLLPAGSALWTNETRVLRARLYGRKPTGGSVELLLLDPDEQSVEQAMSVHSSCVWYVMIGGAKRWKTGDLTFDFEEAQVATDAPDPPANLDLSARRLPEKNGRFRVDFRWTGAQSFGEILETAGTIPLPPYMNRHSDEEDSTRYQTLFAKHLGSVAAPTAGLHFSKDVLQSIAHRKITSHHVTLHVGIGTFKPVSGPLDEHVMHAERCELSPKALDALIAKPERTVVGTTTLRTLESAYWLACLTRSSSETSAAATEVANEAARVTARAAVIAGRQVHIPQWIHRQNLPEYETYEDAISDLRELAQGKIVKFSTEIMIVPGYKIRSTSRLVTNFHMPGSTLLCIIEAAVGPSWRDAYAHAVASGYRFLSYGDACLLNFQSAADH
jgi:S-adenosylmethionine:tRNA ribosyltransferase-isomerase